MRKNQEIKIFLKENENYWEKLKYLRFNVSRYEKLAFKLFEWESIAMIKWGIDI